MKKQIADKFYLGLATVGWVGITLLSNNLHAQQQDQDSKRAEFRAAIQACATENGITLPERGSGVKPSDSDRETIHQCLLAKGFNPPKWGEHRRHQ